MIVRLWTEAGDEPSLRARLTESSDLAASDQTTHAASTVDEIVELVRVWAQQFVER